MNTALAYDELSDALARLGYTHGAAEYHGTLAGALCGRDAEALDPLTILGHATAESGPAARALGSLADQMQAALCNAEMGFAPLLPDDDEPLAARVRALVAWCEGFLYGLSTRPGLDLAACSPEVREIVEDFTQFTRAGLSDDDNQELEEAAYAELTEYIRVSVQIVFMELRGGEDALRAPDAGPTVH